jgi:two-component system, NtrC family, sensor histidine kinase HydH
MPNCAIPDLANSRYALVMSSPQRSWMEDTRMGYVVISGLLLLLAFLSAIVPASEVSAHNILHHLNFLPLMMAGILFGWRGAAVASAIAAVVNAPGITQHWAQWPIDAKDQIVELSIFSVAGLIAGYLSDRERSHRRNLEETQKKLEEIYRELHENVAKMKKAERLSAAGQLAASLAHEIRNPLASISGAAGILRRGAAPPEYVEDSLDIIQKESQRLNKLLTGFLNFANPRSPRLQRTDPGAVLQSVVSLAAHAAEHNHIAVVYRPDQPPPEIECDPEQLKQVLLNLVINAIEASPSDSEIRLKTRSHDNRILIEVEDKGSGIADDASDRVFDPFFTTKPKGTGLGLAVSSIIIAHHGGTLSFHRNEDRGTTFRIDLPVEQEVARVR